MDHCRAVFFTAAALAVLFGSPPASAQDAAAGKQVFNRCRACHDAEKEVNKGGPPLLGIIGRTAGTAPTFLDKYSDAMKAAGAAGLVWDEANLAEYLRAPKAKVPGNQMAFTGLKKDKEIADLIAYLRADPKP